MNNFQIRPSFETKTIEIFKKHILLLKKMK